VFRAIDPPRYLALSTTETRLDGTTLRFETEFTFEAADGGMLMTMIQRGIPTDELRAEHARGVPSAFDRLEQHIHGRDTRPTQTSRVDRKAGLRSRQFSAPEIRLSGNLRLGGRCRPWSGRCHDQRRRCALA
jgi:hypothetical protein